MPSLFTGQPSRIAEPCGVAPLSLFIKHVPTPVHLSQDAKPRPNFAVEAGADSQDRGDHLSTPALARACGQQDQLEVLTGQGSWDWSRVGLSADSCHWGSAIGRQGSRQEVLAALGQATAIVVRATEIVGQATEIVARATEIEDQGSLAGQQDSWVCRHWGPWGGQQAMRIAGLVRNPVVSWVGVLGGSSVLVAARSALRAGQDEVRPEAASA